MKDAHINGIPVRDVNFIASKVESSPGGPDIPMAGSINFTVPCAAHVVGHTLTATIGSETYTVEGETVEQALAAMNELLPGGVTIVKND